MWHLRVGSLTVIWGIKMGHNNQVNVVQPVETDVERVGGQGIASRASCSSKGLET